MIFFFYGGGIAHHRAGLVLNVQGKAKAQKQK